MRSCTASRAVSTRTGVLLLRRRRRRSTSKPSNFGSSTSSTTSSYPCAASAASASGPVATQSTAWPELRSACAIPSARIRSSSTRRMRMAGETARILGGPAYSTLSPTADGSVLRREPRRLHDRPPFLDVLAHDLGEADRRGDGRLHAELDQVLLRVAR